MIVHPDNLVAKKYFVLRHKFKVCMGARYLGTFIGDDESKNFWLKYQMWQWEKKILLSPKQQGNIPRRFVLRWFVRSNWGGSFFNA